MRAVKEWAPQHYNSTGSARLLSLMSRGLLLALIGALLIVRLPSLAQPMGSDQGLYAYVGERIRHGELAYRDAWDQKPPGDPLRLCGAARPCLRATSSSPPRISPRAALVAVLLWIDRRAAWEDRWRGGLSARPLPAALGSRACAARRRARPAQCETFIALADRPPRSLACSRAGAGQGAARPSRAHGFVAAGLLLGARVRVEIQRGTLRRWSSLLALAVTSGADAARRALSRAPGRS